MPDVRKVPPETCVIPDCDGQPQRVGLCWGHYLRRRRYGSPTGQPPARPPVPLTPERQQRMIEGKHRARDARERVLLEDATYLVSMGEYDRDRLAARLGFPRTEAFERAIFRIGGTFAERIIGQTSRFQ